jgi:hypothetical protein
MRTGYLGPKSFRRRILPVSDCVSRILSRFPAKLMIPIDRGGGGIREFCNRTARGTVSMGGSFPGATPCSV